jgi:hypothetical protein
MAQLRIQTRPPLPESLYIGIMLAGRNRAPVPNKMLRSIMRYQGRVCTKSRHFICPCTTKLRAAIATPKIANVIEINFNIARNNIFVSG